MPRIDSNSPVGDGVESIRYVDPRLARARVVLLGLFLLNGVTMSSWLARIPSVRDALGISPAELGVVLLAGAVGALLTVAVAGPLVTRFGGRAVLVASAAFFAAAFVLLGLGPQTGSLALLAVGIFLNGVAFSLGNVPLNVESAGVERRLGRTVLPQFHAAFSIGAVLGSLVGAACAWGGVPLVVQFGVSAVLTTAWRLASVTPVVHDTARRAGATTRPRPDGGLLAPEAADAVVDVETAGVRSRGRRLGASLDAWREPRTLLIGLVILSAALSEGSANDWLSLAVVDGFGQSEAVGAVVFGVFVGAMTVMRLLGTRLIDRYGRVRVLRVSGVTSIAGLLLFGFAPTLPLAAAGVVAWGFGAALAVPLGIAAASDDPLRAAARVSVVSAFASMASLAAPPLLGLAAEHVGARHALVLIVVAMVLSVTLARQVAPLPGSAASAPPRTRYRENAPARALDAGAGPDAADPAPRDRAPHAPHAPIPDRSARRREETPA